MKRTRWHRLVSCWLAAAAAGCAGAPAAPQPGTPAPTAAAPAAPAADAAVQPSDAAAPVPSSELPIEHPAPEFALPDTDGVTRRLADFRGKWVVLEWTNPGCPYVRKHYDSGNMQSLQKKYAAKGVAWLSICSSAPGKQGHAEPSAWKSRAATEGWAVTATLLDPDGKVGRLYGAKVTPHLFVIDPRGDIVYRGAIDDKASAKKSDVETARNHVAEALDAGLSGLVVPVSETKPYG